MKATTQTLRLVAAIALAFAALTATAEKKPVVKVVDSCSDGISYWVKYTINGMEFRSDIAGYRINEKAWKYMSEEDKEKTYETFTFVEDRKEQFGVFCSLAMTTWYNDQNGTTQSRAYLQDGLVKKYHPELWERFSSGNRNKYYNESVKPAVPMGFEENMAGSLYCDEHGCYFCPESYELELKFDEIIILWEWAQAAYDTLGPSEYLRAQAAVKSISGDLIQLICDRVLVPNITPWSGIAPSGIAGIPSKIFGAVLDMGNSLTGAQDSLVKNVAGEKADAKKARLVIDAANEAIESNVKIIKECMDGIQTLRGEIEAQYPALKAAYNERKEAVEKARTEKKADNWEWEDPRIASEEAFATYQNRSVTKYITNQLARDIVNGNSSATEALENWCKSDEDLIAASTVIREFISGKKAFWYGTNHDPELDMYSEAEDPHYKIMETRLQRALDVRAAYLEEQLRRQELRDEGWRSFLQEQQENCARANEAYRLAGETLPIYVTEQQLGPNNLIFLDANTAIGKACLLPAAAGTASAEAAAYRKRLDALMEEKNKLRTACRVADEGLDLVESYLRSGGYGLGNKKQNKVKVANAYSTGDDVATDNYKKLTLLWQDFNNHNRFREWEMTYLLDLYENEEKYKKEIKGRYAKPSEGDAGIIEHEIPDPYLHLALKAREFASHPSTWSNPYMYYSHMIGIYDDGQTLLFEARDGNRGLGSYAYFAKNYYKTYFGGQPDVFDDCVEPYLREIDSARAAASGVAEISYTVSFEPNGGKGANMAPQTFIGYAPQALAANTWAPPSPGETFVGWARTPDGNVIFGDREVIKVSEDMTLYARWSGNYSEGGGSGGSEGGGQGGGGSVTPGYEVLDAKDITEPYAAPKAVTLKGVVYDGGDVAGVVELKLGKVNDRKGTSKVSGSFTGLDGKKITLKAATVENIDGTAPASVSLDVKGRGTMTVTIGGDMFAGSLGEWHVQSDAVGGDGGNPKIGVVVEANDLSKFPGSVLEALLPDGEPFAVVGGKWKFAKAASVKWAKPKKDAPLPEIYDEESGKGLIVDTSKGSNLSGLKLTYTPKKGTFKGKFTVYALEGEGKATKLKKYKVGVTGVVVGGVGYGEATCKKPAVRWTVTVE